MEISPNWKRLSSQLDLKKKQFKRNKPNTKSVEEENSKDCDKTSRSSQPKSIKNDLTTTELRELSLTLSKMLMNERKERQNLENMSPFIVSLSVLATKEL